MSFNYKRPVEKKTVVYTGAAGCLVFIGFILLGLLFLAGISAILGFLIMIIWNNLIVPNTSANLTEIPFALSFGISLLLVIVSNIFRSGSSK